MTSTVVQGRKSRGGDYTWNPNPGLCFRFVSEFQNETGPSHRRRLSWTVFCRPLLSRLRVCTSTRSALFRHDVSVP